MIAPATPPRLTAAQAQKVVEECRRRLKENHGDVGAALRLADALEVLGDKKEAAQLLNRLGPALQRKGRLVEAVAVYKKVVRLDPKAEMTSSFLSHLELKNLLEAARSASDPTAPGAPVPPASPAHPSGATPPDAGAPPEAPVDPEATARRRKKQRVDEVRAGIPLLKDVAPFLFELVLEKVHLRSLAAGEVLFSEGSTGSSIVFVATGAVRVSGRRHDGQEVVLQTLLPGDVAGEVSFLTGAPRTATLTATGPTDVLELDRQAVNPLVKKHRQLADALATLYAERVMDGVLARSRLFASLPRRDRDSLARRFKPSRALAGDQIVREGDVDSGLFLIREGSVRVTSHRSEKDVALALLRTGDVFGDVATVLGRPRTATVTAVTDVELLRLPREDVLTLLSHRPQVRAALEEIQLERFAANARLLAQAD